MNAPAARPLRATPRPSESKRRISNRELELLEPLLTYAKQTIAPRSNRELSTISRIPSRHEAVSDRRSELFGADILDRDQSPAMTYTWGVSLL
jgi:hypothetical protein